MAFLLYGAGKKDCGDGVYRELRLFCRFEWKGGTERLDRKSGCICGSDRKINAPEIQNPALSRRACLCQRGNVLLTMRVPEAHGMRLQNCRYKFKIAEES